MAQSALGTAEDLAAISESDQTSDWVFPFQEKFVTSSLSSVGIRHANASNAELIIYEQTEATSNDHFYWGGFVFGAGSAIANPMGAKVGRYDSRFCGNGGVGALLRSLLLRLHVLER